ncbi:Bug family tripartite tricarboxylate transporter substrate binding protein [Plastoroseomonas arctica]|uniref:Tripartite tricarboxylate transporter substrate binding protein n=1 Tax=Plastoroseomonas arctica TaxID=1509237 RepID=A0AAF1K037_9PROT|nr:tripartite tricarboxylate transporter substrate binding protein [Plastoroseomonas arctica]MBR0654681.1 tripartite tricarboxylate transporter substrate binding protein [Plastoroseomonas arctica]
MITRRPLLLAAATLPLAAPAIAQAPRPARWVIPFPPGGAADAIGRLWADAVTSTTGQPVVIENRGGANGVLGVQQVVQAPPDGFTLGVFSIAFFTALPIMMARPPYDPVRDLAPVVQLVTSTVMCCVTAERARERGWADFASLIAWAKRPGNRLTKGSAGNGSAAHLLIATIARRTGAEIEHVPYRGGAPALNDLISGNIDMVFDFMPALMPHVASGRLVALAVGSNARSPLMPEVPGLGEFASLGIGDLDMQSWNALTAPGATPAPVQAEIAAAIRRSLAAPELDRRLRAAGLIPVITEGPAETRAKIAADAPRWREMVETSGARIE